MFAIAVKQSQWCVPDETGWKVGGLLQWLHVFVTERATLYLIRPSRGFDVAAEALGANYAGALTHDGWKTYEQFESAVLVSITEKIDTTSAAGKMLYRLLSVLAEYGLRLSLEKSR